MIERIERDGVLYAIIIRARYEPKSTEFYTPKENSLQMGIIRHEKGYIEKPHVHKQKRKEITDVQETLQLTCGKVAFDFYNDKGKKVASTTLEKGDAILLAEGAHAIKAPEDFWGVKVKQGPYVSIEEDKRVLEEFDDSGL